jgi:hypothetical protein
MAVRVTEKNPESGFGLLYRNVPHLSTGKAEVLQLIYKGNAE